MSTKRGLVIAGVVMALMSAAAPAHAIPLDECFDLDGLPEDDTCTTTLEVTQEECEGGGGTIQLLDLLTQTGECQAGEYEGAEIVGPITLF